MARDRATRRGYESARNVTENAGWTAAIAFYQATGWTYTHTSDAGWTGPDGGRFRLRRYAAGER